MPTIQSASETQPTAKHPFKEETRRISIAQWHALARSGTVLPMRIPLDGDSMRPLIRRNRDLVSIIPLTRPLKRGDVVLFEYPAGRYVVHRVRRMKESHVQTLGDHCWNPDPWMPQDCVLGLVTEAERNGRRIPFDTPFARGLGRVWMAGLPLRRLWWKCKALAGRVLRKLGWRK